MRNCSENSFVGCVLRTINPARRAGKRSASRLSLVPKLLLGNVNFPPSSCLGHMAQ